MPTATLSKNGMIHLPADIRDRFNLKPGDKISFVETGESVMVVPVRDLFDLIQSEDRKKTNEAVEELKQEHLAETRE